MKKRLTTAAIMLIILLPLILIDNVITEYLYLVLVGFISFVGTYEFIRGSSKESSAYHLRFLMCSLSSIIAISSSLTAMASKSSDYFFVFNGITLFTYILGIIILLGSLIFIKQSTANDLVNSIFALTYSGLLLGMAFSLRFMSPINLNATILNINGPMCFAFVYLIVVMTDTFAFIFGCKFGKHKLCPHVSPKKSVEGAIAGLIGGGLTGIGGMFLFNIIDTNVSNVNILNIIIVCFVLSLVISFFVQMGDLVESKLKRSYEVKDFGSLLPGHGGILDRFDSFIYSGSLVFILIVLLEGILYIK